MSCAGKTMLLASLTLWVTGCATFHKKPVTAVQPVPPSAPTESATTDKPGPLFPPPLSTPPAETTPAPPPVQASAEVAPKPAPPKPAAHPRKPSTASKNKGPAGKPAAGTPASASASGPAALTAQQTAAAEAASPIGTLTTGVGESSGQKRRETSDLINNTEQGLNGIKRSLSTQEQETATQIRTFLKQAKEALKIDDVDGANTLATKAKVLLAELTTP